jgi:hypothetical protein
VKGTHVLQKAQILMPCLLAVVATGCGTQSNSGSDGPTAPVVSYEAATKVIAGSQSREDPAPTPERIKQFIANLAELESPDFGLSPTVSGRCFAPVEGSAKVGVMLLTDHHIKPSQALRKLVELGPHAVPVGSAG